MNKYILALCLLFCSKIISQEKPTLYLFFEEGKQSTCNFRPQIDKIKTIELKYSYKRYRKVGVTWFFLCKQQFVFKFKTDFFKIITEEEFKKIKITTVEELLELRYQHPATENPQELVEKIYLVEAIESNQYAVYGVIWKNQ